MIATAFLVVPINAFVCGGSSHCGRAVAEDLRLVDVNKTRWKPQKKKTVLESPATIHTRHRPGIQGWTLPCKLAQNAWAKIAAISGRKICILNPSCRCELEFGLLSRGTLIPAG